MVFPAKKIVELLVNHDPASPEFRNGVRETLGSSEVAPQAVGAGAASTDLANPDLDLWKDVFVNRPLPWGRFLQSAALHTLALALIWGLSLAWLRQQKILTPIPFDRSSLITYAPEEYLPPLDTGQTDPPKQEKADPAFAKQPILSVPREADNRSQTVVVPPDLKLDHDVPLPNIVATGAIAPIVPLNATNSLSNRAVAPDPQVVAPTPEVNFARERIIQSALKSDVVPPTPELSQTRNRSLAGPETAVVEPPPSLTVPAKGRAGVINIGPSQVVAPAPQLAMSEQHALYGRGSSGGKDSASGSVQPVAPPPSVGASGGGAQGRIVALNLHPISPTGPVPVPAGNRRGTFSANPQGKPGATGTPNSSGSQSGSGGNAFKTRNGLPSGLHVGAVPGVAGPIERNGASGGTGTGDSNGEREVASLSSADAPLASTAGRRAASAISDDKVTEADRQVFGDRRMYGTTLNMPNLNSATGSWVMHFAEMQFDPKQGELLQPLPTEKSDPGYPLALMRANVHGTVTLYAVIHSDGKVGDIRVISSPDERLDAWAKSALSGWKFLPALRSGKPVAVEAVVEIPFRARSAF
jgi:TonB family protein